MNKLYQVSLQSVPKKFNELEIESIWPKAFISIIPLPSIPNLQFWECLFQLIPLLYRQETQFDFFKQRYLKVWFLEPISLKNLLTYSFTSTIVYTKPLIVFIDPMKFFLFLSFMTLWENLVFKSPSLIHFDLDFYLSKLSFWLIVKWVAIATTASRKASDRVAFYPIITYKRKA